MFEVESCCACSVCKADSRLLTGGETIVSSAIEGEANYDSGSLIYANGVDIPGNPSTNTTISVGESVTDELEVIGDTDWFRIELTAGQTISILLEGTGTSPVADTYVRVFNSNGLELARNDDGGEGLNSLMRFTASNAGTYYIEADSYDSSETGEYTLTVEEAQPLELFTVDQIADQLTTGYWGGTPRAFDVGADNAISVNFTTLGTQEISLARQALNLWTDVIGVDFIEVDSNAEITFTNTEEGAYSSSSRIGSRITSSIVNVDSAWVQNYGTTLNSYSFQTYLHEIGHALGLGHAGNYNGNASYANDALYLNDAWSTTIMSYFDQADNTYFTQLGFDVVPLTSPMVADVAAMQDLYGLSTTTRTYDTVYGFNSNSDRTIHHADKFSSTAYTIVDSGGYDVLNYSGWYSRQLIDLNPEQFMNVGGKIGNVSIARGTLIEEARGGDFIDVIIGNDVVNTLIGNGGDDELRGGSGSDLLYGGAASDHIYGDAGWDKIWGGNEPDRIWGGNGGDVIHGEHGNDTSWGEDGPDYLRGGDHDDYLYGGNDADRIYGDEGADILHGDSGADKLYGGLGVDKIHGGTGADVLSGESGSDFLFGDAGNDVLLGGPGWDKLYGSEGSDELSGGNGGDFLSGGFGVDLLTGGNGTDTFEVEMFGEANLNIITDFNAGEDSIALRRNVGFGELAWGQLAGSAFTYGTEANDADDRIIYQWSTGKLFYDPDGAGGEQAYLFAQVTAQTALSASHFTAVGASAPPPVLGGADAILGADALVL